MGFTRKTEIKDISSTEISKIAKLLNQSFAWKKVMQTVPSELTDAVLLNEGTQKYNLSHIRLIETASLRSNNDRSASQIFLEDWMTTGRIRPTLSHLLQLLVKCELFRAADYVAVNLLSEEAPKRPERGPAAKVDISLPLEDGDIDIQGRVSDINSVNATEIRNLNSSIQSKQIHDKEILLVHTPMSEAENTSNNGQVHLNRILSHQQGVTTNGATQRSEVNQSQKSASKSSISSTMSSAIMPNISLLDIQFNNLSNSVSADHGEDVVPNLSILNLNDGADSRNLSKSNLQDCEEVNVPNLSILHLRDDADSHNSIEQEGLTENIPQFSALMD